MTHRVICMLGLAGLSLVPATAAAVEVLSAEELTSHCAAFPGEIDSADGQYCIRYIQGFVDGAVATDARVMMNLEAERARKETFTERAIRTRAPGQEARRRAAIYAEFCLGDPVPLLEVVEKVVEDLNERRHLEPELTARAAVYRSLRQHYPCRKQ